MSDFRLPRERRQVNREKWSVSRWISSVVMLAIILPSFAMATSADGCDWIGSGLETSLESKSGEEHGVKPVYLRCSQGSVSWLYPRGALRVVLRYGTAGKEFQGCLKLSAEFGGANIYVEQHRTLKLLHSASSLARPDGKRHCFESHRGQVSLFLESDSGADPLRRETAAFDYDLQLVDDQYQSHDPWQECRPCSPKESLELFCSSDFVAKGSISSVYNDDQLERTLMTVRATRVIRQATDVFQPTKKRRSVAHQWRSNKDVMTNDVSEDEEHSGTLHLPLTCQVKHGSGEFIFMGRRRLGDAVLWCAPRLEEWQDWVRQAQQEGSAQCHLEA